MDFQVNGETYFVTLGEGEPGWEVFVSTPTGARSLPVYVDRLESDDVKVVVEDTHRRKIVN